MKTDAQTIKSRLALPSLYDRRPILDFFRIINVFFYYFRQPFMKQNNLEDFEFSPGYLFYWDKVRLCYTFLIYSSYLPIPWRQVMRIYK